MSNAKKEHARYSKEAEAFKARLNAVRDAYTAQADKDSQEAKALARKVTYWETRHEASQDAAHLWKLAAAMQSMGMNGGICYWGSGSGEATF